MLRAKSSRNPFDCKGAENERRILASLPEVALMYAEDRANNLKISVVTKSTVLGGMHHCNRKADGAKFHLARAPGIREALKPRSTEGPRLESVFISDEKETPMFARILDFEVKPEKKEEFVKVVKNEIVPILKKQIGFLEILPFVQERMREEKVITISLWATKADAERYEREFYPKALNILQPFLTTPVSVNYYKLETAVCEHFVDALAA